MNSKGLDKDTKNKLQILSNQMNVIGGLVKRLDSEWMYLKKALGCQSYDMDRALNILRNEIRRFPESESRRIKGGTP